MGRGGRAGPGVRSGGAGLVSGIALELFGLSRSSPLCRPGKLAACPLRAELPASSLPPVAVLWEATGCLSTALVC